MQALIIKNNRPYFVSCDTGEETRLCTQQEVDDQAIKFARWIAAMGEGQKTLIDGNYYYADDNDGDQPLSEKELYDQFKKEQKAE